MHFYFPILHNSAIATHMMRWPPNSPFNKKVGRDCEICICSRSINIFCLLWEWFQQDAGSAKSFRPMTNGSISVPESFICGKVDQRLTLLTLLIHGIAREFFSADSNCSGQKSNKEPKRGCHTSWQNSTLIPASHMTHRMASWKMKHVIADNQALTRCLSTFVKV